MLLYCDESHLVIFCHSPSVPTFHHFTDDTTSTVDYIITANDQSAAISSIGVDMSNSINYSSNDAILATLVLHLKLGNSLKKHEQICHLGYNGIK